MKRTICILLTFFMFVVLFSGCAAGQSTESTLNPTEAPTATPVPATAPPEPTPSVTPEPTPEVPVYTEDEEWARELILSNRLSLNRIYSIDEFLDLPVGRVTMLDLYEMHMDGYSETLNYPSSKFNTADPDIYIFLAYRWGDMVCTRLEYEHKDLSTYDRNVNLEGTYVDANELGIHEITKEEGENIVLDRTYTLRDFAWIKPGETTFEEVCVYTETEDYFYFNTNEKVLCYPAEVPGSYFFIHANADDIVYCVSNKWDSEKDPEEEEFFTEEYLAEQLRKMMLIAEVTEEMNY